MPILQKDTEEAAASAAAEIVDARARHFWNPDNALARDAARALRMGPEVENAWDVFLIYGPDVTWSGDSLPPPTAWMHRVQPDDVRWMTPKALSRAIRALLPED